MMMTYHPMAYHPNDDEVISMTYHPMIMREIRNYISPAAKNKMKEQWERLLQKLDFVFGSCGMHYQLNARCHLIREDRFAPVQLIELALADTSLCECHKMELGFNMKM
jgi:hypothetical protein